MTATRVEVLLAHAFDIDAMVAVLIEAVSRVWPMANAGQHVRATLTVLGLMGKSQFEAMEIVWSVVDRISEARGPAELQVAW